MFIPTVDVETTDLQFRGKITLESDQLSKVRVPLPGCEAQQEFVGGMPYTVTKSFHLTLKCWASDQLG